MTFRLIFEYFFYHLQYQGIVASGQFQALMKKQRRVVNSYHVSIRFSSSLRLISSPSDKSPCCQHLSKGIDSKSLGFRLTQCTAARDVESAINIWSTSALPQRHHPTVKSYQTLIKLIAKHGNLEHRNFGNQMITELKEQIISGSSETHRQWWTVINYYRLCSDVDQMLHEYRSMLASGAKPTKYILSSLFEGLIKGGHPYHVESIWNELLKTFHRWDLCKVFNSRVLQSMIICIDQSGNRLPRSLLFDVWTLLVDEIGIVSELHCCCLATFVLSKQINHSLSLELCRNLLSQLREDKQMMLSIKRQENAMYFRQILSSYGNIGELHAMWSFYNLIKQGRNDDILSVNVLASMESRHDVLRDKVLNGILVNIDLDTLKTSDLIGFYRIASKCDENNMKEKLWQILTKRQQNGGIKTNVVSRFQLHAREHLMENGYGSCEFKSVTLVEQIMQEIGYCINTSPALELKDTTAQERHLKSHSEKKALAVLMNTDSETKSIRIAVSMRMCSDCHRFFSSVSKYYDKEIVCVDPRGVHLFINGSCALCAV